MSGLPSGTVTLLFTDIEGSTRLLHQLGHRYADALAAHRRIMRASFTDRGGHEVDTQGDAFLVAFASASEAVSAAVTAQRRLAEEPWPDGTELRVRMGIHTGEPTLTDEGYVGIDLHRGARICSAGHGGQILVSEATHQLLSQRSIEEIELRDLGLHRLKDLSQAQRLHQVVGEGLLREFPPLKALGHHPNNLSTQPTPLLGRVVELDTLRTLLRDRRARLVTLTGPGGSGKTRLALQAAADLLDDFPDGVFVVELAAVADPALLLPTVAQTMGIRPGGGRTAEETLRAFLAERSVLLVLDNLEQIVSAAPSVADLLAHSPHVCVVVTSRQSLRVAAEQEFPVAPLPVPDQRRIETADASDLLRYDAVRLFVERAQAVRPAFTLTDENAPAVAEICARLDGLPLAIELASARMKVLPPQAVLARLDQRLRLLVGGKQGVPSRQQTLRGAIDWSFELLAQPERRLFTWLGSFVDGWSLEAAEAVCGSDATVDVLDGLTSLVDKSLVRQVELPGGEARFFMLETVREYAREILDSASEAASVRDRHATFYCDLAAQAGRQMRSSAAHRAGGRLRTEHGNLRAALDRLSATGDVESALQLVIGAWRTWIKQGQLLEGRTLIENVLAQPGQPDSIERAFALGILGEFYRFQGDFDRAWQVKQDALPGALRTAPWLHVALLDDLGQIAQDLGRPDDAAALFDRALGLAHEMSDPSSVAHVMCGIGRLNIEKGELDEARTNYEQVREAGLQLDDYEYLNESLLGLALIARRKQDDARADTLYQEALRLATGMDDLTYAIDALAGLASLAVDRGDAARASRLLGAVDAVCTSSGLVLYFPDEREEVLAAAGEMLGRTERESAFAEGMRMPLDEATAYALDK